MRTQAHYYLQTQVQILIADSGAIHTNVTQAHVCEMWTLAHFLSVDSGTDFFNFFSVLMRHKHMYVSFYFHIIFEIFLQMFFDKYL